MTDERICEHEMGEILEQSESKDYTRYRCKKCGAEVVCQWFTLEIKNPRSIGILYDE